MPTQFGSLRAEMLAVATGTRKAASHQFWGVMGFLAAIVTALLTGVLPR